MQGTVARSASEISTCRISQATRQQRLGTRALRYLTNPAGQHFPEHKAREIAPPKVCGVGSAPRGSATQRDPNRRRFHATPPRNVLESGGMGFPPVELLGNLDLVSPKTVASGGGNVTCVCVCSPVPWSSSSITKRLYSILAISHPQIRKLLGLLS